MRIGIFGGAFNPPHIGHVNAAKTAFAQYSLDKLIIIPTGTPPHKELPTNSPAPQLRLQMTINAFMNIKDDICNSSHSNNSCSCIEISDYEIFSNEKNFTIDTISQLRKSYPDAELFMLVGTDMYNTLSSWKDSDLLLDEVTPIELSRDVTPISSSELRDLLPQRKGREYVSDANYALIIKERLYSSKSDWEWLRQQAYAMLDPLRIPHVAACEVEACRLAEHWGVNTDDAREAAILHDITKKLDFCENMCIISEHGITIDKLEKNGEKLLHSISGALIAMSDFGVSKSVSNAIKWHTTGRAGMTMLEKIIYIADYIEETRNFPGVDELRRLAYSDINKAMLMGLEMTVDDLRSRDIPPDTSTLEAIQDLLSIISHNA